MDNFMDELVQKYTPQDLIRANSAAEAAEIEGLEKQVTLFREQMDKYDDCLTEMRQVNQRNIEAARDVQQLADQAQERIGKSMGEMAETSIAGIRETQDASIAGIRETQDASIAKIKETQDASIAGINKAIEESLAKISEVQSSANNTEEINGIVSELREKLEGILKTQEEFLHTDNVRVYRNVQATLVEELTKQTNELKDTMEEDSKKSKVLLPFAIVTMVIAIANTALLALHIFGIL